METIDELFASFDEAAEQCLLEDHDSCIEFLNEMNLYQRDIDALKRTVFVSLEQNDDELYNGIIWLSALNTYKNTKLGE